VIIASATARPKPGWTLRCPARLGDLGLGGGQVFRGTAHVATLDLAGSELHLARPDGAPMALTVAARRVAMGDGWLAGPGLDGARRLRLAGADLEGAKVDVAARQADLGTLQLAGLNVSLRREANGAIDLMRLLPPPSAAGAAAALGLRIGRGRRIWANFRFRAGRCMWRTARCRAARVSRLPRFPPRRAGWAVI
jgi:hypothetical protein